MKLQAYGRKRWANESGWVAGGVWGAIKAAVPFRSMVRILMILRSVRLPRITAATRRERVTKGSGQVVVIDHVGSLRKRWR
jgi:hypothetical protein